MRGGHARFGGGRASAHAPTAVPRVSFGVRYGSPRFGVTFRQPYYPRYYHHHTRFPYYPYYTYPYYGAYGYPGNYGYAGYWGGYYPLYWDSSSSYETGRDVYYQQNLEVQQQLQQQVNELGNEVEQLRAEQQARLAPPAPPPAPRPTAPPKPAQPTTLVFRDGKSEQVQNYAIVGHTLWVFSEQRARKIPLDQLDLATTQQVNEDQGVDFAGPK
jgi:hypothetical protein